jgi:hypothetical protein
VHLDEQGTVPGIRAQRAEFGIHLKHDRAASTFQRLEGAIEVTDCDLKPGNLVARNRTVRRARF